MKCDLLFELLDRVYVSGENFHRNIATHEAAYHPKLAAAIDKLCIDLFDLYQSVANVASEEESE